MVPMDINIGFQGLALIQESTTLIHAEFEQTWAGKWIESMNDVFHAFLKSNTYYGISVLQC